MITPDGADRSLDVADELHPHAEPTGIRYPSAMDVVCLGILVADAIARPVGELPERGSLALVDEISLHGGGCALNTASALVRLGLSSGAAGKVGDDALGAFLLALLDERGVDRDGVLVDPAVATSGTVVLVDSSGERTFLHLPGASASLRADELDRGVPASRDGASTSRVRSCWKRSTASPQRVCSPRRGRAGS